MRFTLKLLLLTVKIVQNFNKKQIGVAKCCICLPELTEDE